MKVWGKGLPPECKGQFFQCIQHTCKRKKEKEKNASFKLNNGSSNCHSFPNYVRPEKKLVADHITNTYFSNHFLPSTKNKKLGSGEGPMWHWPSQCLIQKYFST